jgi:hypothetical protein
MAEVNTLFKGAKQVIDADASDQPWKVVEQKSEPLIQKETKPTFKEQHISAPEETDRTEKVSKFLPSSLKKEQTPQKAATAPKVKVNENELLNEEQNQLVKNIDVDLKVLAKILKQKNPKLGEFHLKLIKVDDEETQEAEKAAQP